MAVDYSTHQEYARRFCLGARSRPLSALVALSAEIRRAGLSCDPRWLSVRREIARSIGRSEADVRCVARLLRGA